MGEDGEPRHRARAGAAGAVIVGFVAVLVLGLSRDAASTVTAQFQHRSALVTGQQVVIGARPVGSVEEIRLAPDGQANVTFAVDEEFAPLRTGTVATVRWASLSS